MKPWMMGLTLVATGCTNLFQENFEEMELGAPGSATVGTMRATGDVTIVGAPTEDCPQAGGSRWARIVQPPADSQLSAEFTPVWDGQATLALVVCVAEGSGDFSIDLVGERPEERIGHLDLMGSGDVRLEDAAVIGTFSHGEVVAVLATMREDEIAWSITGDSAINETWDTTLLSATGWSSVDLHFADGASGTAYVDEWTVSVPDEEG